MSAMLFRKHCLHVCFVSGAGRNGKNVTIFVTKVSTSRKCLQAKQHISIGVKRHRSNQSQNCMANHVIWLKNRGSCGRDDGERVTAAVTVRQTATESFESWEICDIKRVWSVQLRCYVVLDVVCLLCSGVVFLCCESKQGDCWMWSRQERAEEPWAWGIACI